MSADAAVEALAAFPRGVTDPFCPRGDVIETSTDHRILWHVEMALSGSGDANSRELGRAIRRYLNAACEHHWHSFEAEEHIPAHDQCLWCNDVVWRDAESGGAS